MLPGIASQVNYLFLHPRLRMWGIQLKVPELLLTAILRPVVGETRALEEAGRRTTKWALGPLLH